MKAKQELGPQDGWKAGRATKPYIIDGRGQYVALNLRSDYEARLIAAAPELLAALKKAQEALSFTPGYYTKRGPLADTIRAAIAKAEGR